MSLQLRRQSARYCARGHVRLQVAGQHDHPPRQRGPSRSATSVRYAPEVIQPECFAQGHGRRCDSRADIVVEVST